MRVYCGAVATPGARPLFPGGRPFADVGQVEDPEIVLGRRPSGGVAAGSCELGVIWRAVVAQHDSLEAAIALEAMEHREAQAIAVEGQQRVEIVARTGDSQDR